VAQTVIQEIQAAASEEAKEVGLAATRRVKKLGEQRRQQRPERPHATPAARKAAEAQGVDLDLIEGSGAEGRITVADIRKAQ
jgi:pyruvate/2-oxoglutarate dehydrogenase complex dihydrolipoamide acyltransferase (E2) component